MLFLGEQASSLSDHRAFIKNISFSMFTAQMTGQPMRKQEAPCLNAKKVGVLTGPD